MPIYGPDISSYQGNPDMGAVGGGGNDFVIIKVTESTNYVNPTWQAARGNAHAAGLIVGLYHFAGNGNPQAEAQYFLNTVGGLQDGEFLVLDWEVPGDAANWSKAWLDAIQAATGVKPFVYLNQYYVNNFDWSAVQAAGYPLWVAIYDGDPATFQPMKFWGAPLLKQYTDAAQIPGIAGNVDRNSFNGDRNALLAYGFGGDMPSADEIAAAVWKYAIGGQDMASVGSQEAWAALAGIFGRLAQTHDRVFGMMPQHYYKDNGDGTITQVDAGTAGAQPATVLDTISGNYLVQQISALNAALQAVTKALASGTGADPAAIGKAVQDAVAAALKNIHVVTDPPAGS